MDAEQTILKQEVVETWLKSHEPGDTFTVKDCWDEIGIIHAENKQHLRMILTRCIKKEIIVKSSMNGHYRVLDNKEIYQDWQAANPDNVYPLLLPFDIHKYAKVYPKSIIIVAGEKQAGKTNFLYETVQLNMGTLPVDLFNSETGLEQMKVRFEPYNIPTPAPFKVIERYANFSDIIKSSHLSILDYLDYNSEVYQCAEEINLIFQKLTTGVCIIGMQKPPPTLVKQRDGSMKKVSRDLAYGGAFSAKRAALYITLGQNICKLVHVKNPAIKGQNPNNMQWSYSFSPDGRFTNIKPHQGDGCYE